MASQLTAAERKTLNAAMEIILARTPENASWMFDARRADYGTSYGATYFTRRKEQHSFLRGETFADKVQAAILLQDAEDGDEDGVRARRIAKLRDELASLEQAA